MHVLLGRESAQPYDAPVRVVILGGTRFIGRAVVERLAPDHEVLVVHRGLTEPLGMPDVRHVHVDRAELGSVRTELREFRPDALVDVSGMSAPSARGALDVFGAELRIVAISSVDVYRAYASFHRGIPVEPMPLTELSPRRAPEHWYIDRPDEENVEFEDVYFAAGATVLRLGAVYGPHSDPSRLDFVLRRVRAGRPHIPIGAGSLRFSRVYVHDVARAVERAITVGGIGGQAFNVCESDTWDYAEFAAQIVAAAGSDAELIRVPGQVLPADMLITATFRQDLLADATLGREVLGWEETDRVEALEHSVRWELAHPPANPDLDFGPDDRALAESPREREP